jgi:alkyl hydroperoxide reductase subunit AhpF
MLSEDEAAKLRQICKDLENPVDFTLYQKEESDFGLKMESFLDEISALSEGKIRYMKGHSDSDLPLTPCFQIGSEGQISITYAAVPLGHQFKPFAGAIERIGLGRRPATGVNPDPSDLQAELQVLISENCPRCPVVVEAVVQLSGNHSQIVPSIVDAEQFPKMAKEFGVKSVPATVLDKRLVLIGNVSSDRLMKLMKSRGTPEFEKEVVQSLVDTGRIPDAARSLEQSAGREVVLALMQNPDFSKRLSGLMVVETALEENAASVRAMVPSLIKMLSHEDSRIRGDIADLLGRVGDPQVIRYLEPLSSDPDPDVVEAATEAIEELRKLQ